MAWPSSRATESTTIFLHRRPASLERHRIGDDQLIERRLLDAIDGRARQHAVHRAREHALGAGVLERLRRLLDRAGGVDDVVLQDARAAAHVADDVHHLGRAVLGAPLVDDGQLAVETLGVGAGPLGAAGVGRHDREIRVVQPRAVVDDDRRREQVIHRDVEEALDLRLVQVHREHAVGAGRAQQVGHQLGRDRHARLVLAVLPGVAVIRHDGRDARRGRAAEGVDHHQQLHQVLIHRVRRRLDDEDVGAADVLVDLERHLAVGKPPEPRLAERQARASRQSPSTAAGGRCRRKSSAHRIRWRRGLLR